VTGTIQQLDFNVDLLKAILWQYNEAENLQALLQNKSEWYDANHTQFWQDWYRDVFDLRTANDFGLQVWSIILDVPLIVVVEPPASPTVPWAFGNYRKNFGRGNFGRSTAGTQQLTVEQSRTVLQLRYFQLTNAGAVPEINDFMNYLFGNEGLVYVVDNLDMTCQYVFTFPLPSQLQLVFQKFDLLPRPAGVSASYTVILP
jgi:hypothetical protein